MLQEVRIADEASYSAAGETLASLKPINFIFGTNGSGKTTISRVIIDPKAYGSCALKWESGKTLACFAYNIDFVSRNFASRLPGVFTLGEAASDTLDKIDKARSKMKDLNDDIAQLQEILGPTDASFGKRAELSALRAVFEDNCWRIKTKHDTHFRSAFAGVRQSRAKFCERVLSEAAVSTANPVAFDRLKSKAATLFEDGLERCVAVPMIDVASLLDLERTPVLMKTVVGKQDIDIAALMRRLGNSDWVRQGLPYLARGSECPFCQQTVDAALAARLNEYFDEASRTDMAAIAAAVETYDSLADVTVKRIQAIIAFGHRYLDQDLLRADLDRLSARIAMNKRLLEAKMREPSRSVRLEPLAELTEPIMTRIAAANTATASHNALVDNLAAERRRLIVEIWQFLLDENSIMIKRFQADRSGLSKAVEELEGRIAERERQLAAVGAVLTALQKNVTSVEPTVANINGLLRGFGFSGFRLRTAPGSNHLYEIVRSDGNNAAATLSEGEKNFVCFLYFYYLLKGSLSASDTVSDRVVVFDDPVSSLDSDVLFVVSSLIKRLLKEACDGRTPIKQVFLLTHNIYFHKEVTFDPGRGADCKLHETFWIVRKVEGVSKITGYKHNPIKTSYELLWAEVRNPNRSNLTIQNTLRRIIESYFKILGNRDKDYIIAKFDGQDRQVCAALFSWVNDGSHSAHDDLYISIDEGAVARYLDVFRRIFDKTDHSGHYKMMMTL